MVAGLFLAVPPVQVESAPQGEEANPLPMAEIELLTEVYSRIKRDYVEEVDDERLFRGAARGMLSQLDEHSRYLDEEALDRLQEGTRGEFGGVGVELAPDGELFRIVAPIEGTPASRAGLQAGDIVAKVDGKSLSGLSLNEATQRMRGEVGSTVSITVLSAGEDGRMRETLELERETVQVDSVESRSLEPGYGYIRIGQFQEDTASELYEALQGLHNGIEGGLDGLILDLRNNPGGVFHAAVAVADTFLRRGRITYTEGRAADAELTFQAGPVDRAHGAPMVVLVNGGSASGSEIVAGALKDHDRAVIMGRPSFGKASVQSVVPLEERDQAIKLTTARYYTPRGRSIQGKGIQPDIVVEALRLAERTEKGEPDEGNRGERAAPDAPRRLGPGGEAAGELAQDDYLLYEALSLLQGLQVFQRR